MTRARSAAPAGSSSLGARARSQVVWEQWIIPVLVTTTPQPTGTDGASALERRRLRAAGEALLQGRLHAIFEMVNAEVDHVPPVMYEYEIVASARGTGDQRAAGFMQAPVIMTH